VPALADTRTVKARHLIGAAVATALLALPASASAGQSGQVAGVAAEQCSVLRADLGKRAFRKRYGPRHAMRNCIRRNRSKAATALNSATDDCQQELAEVGSAEFILDYAWDEDTVENAMSECISDTLDEALAADDEDDEDSDE
jgi:hypothetical protein